MIIWRLLLWGLGGRVFKNPKNVLSKYGALSYKVGGRRADGCFDHYLGWKSSEEISYTGFIRNIFPGIFWREERHACLVQGKMLTDAHQVIHEKGKMDAREASKPACWDDLTSPRSWEVVSHVVSFLIVSPSVITGKKKRGK